MWDVLRTYIDLEGPTSFLNQVYLFGTQRGAEVCHEAVQAKADLLHLLTTTEGVNGKQRKNTNSSHSITAWSYDVGGHAEKCVE